MIYNTLKYIFNHPFNSENRWAALIRFIKWQINTKLDPNPIIYQFTENSKLLIKKGMTGATGNIYCGLMEFEDMGFLLHFLRPTDLFLDVGANIGAYSILASGEIGSHTIAIEPIPSTFGHLTNNIAVNQIQEKVRAYNIGLSSVKGIVRFTKAFDAINHVATPEELYTIDVEVDILDSLMKDTPSLIKIDVEGFETEVINGATRILNDPKLKAIIIELNGSGIRYGYDENLIHDKFLKLNFKPYNYNPKTRKLVEISKFGNHNTIYIRDLVFVTERIKKSRRIKIAKKEI